MTEIIKADLFKQCDGPGCEREIAAADWPGESWCMTWSIHGNKHFCCPAHQEAWEKAEQERKRQIWERHYWRYRPEIDWLKGALETYDGSSEQLATLVDDIHERFCEDD
jgi:hypothetical protein